MKKIKILFLLLLAGGGLSHASVQKTLFSADVVASACHVVVDADGTGSSRLTFGTYRKSSAAPVPPRDFTVRLYETGATVQGCSAFLAGQIATLNFGNPGQLDGQGVVTRGAGDGSDIKHLIVAIFFAFLFLWASWALRTVYVGWSNQDVRGDAVGIFVIRAVILLELAILFFSY